MTLTDWIPVIIAFLTTLTAIFEVLGKKKAQKITGVLVDAVEMWDSKKLKEDIEWAAEGAGVGKALEKIVDDRTEPVKPPVKQ